MKNYINNTIVHSIYFDISKDYFDTNETNEVNEINKPYYFTEEQKNAKGNQYLIAHLFLGNVNSTDEWIQKNNKMTINFLKTKMQVILAKEYFMVEKALERELILHNLIDEKTKIDIQEKNDDKGFYGKFLLIKNPEVKNSRLANFVENREFNILGYTPNYIFYKDEKRSEFVIEVECPGEEDKDKDMTITAKTKKGKVYFTKEVKKYILMLLRNNFIKKISLIQYFFRLM